MKRFLLKTTSLSNKHIYFGYSQKICANISIKESRNFKLYSAINSFVIFLSSFLKIKKLLILHLSLISFNIFLTFFSATEGKQKTFFSIYFDNFLKFQKLQIFVIKIIQLFYFLLVMKEAQDVLKT